MEWKIAFDDPTKQLYIRYLFPSSKRSQSWSVSVYIGPSNTFTNQHSVSAEETKRYTSIIDKILSESDLNTISEKRIRRQLGEKVDKDLTVQKVDLYMILPCS